jgi:hypothetical protein
LVSEPSPSVGATVVQSQIETELLPSIIQGLGIITLDNKVITAKVKEIIFAKLFFLI